MLVNKNTNMVKQLYYSKILLKNIEIYLSKLYIGKYSEINDVISTHKNTTDALLIISLCASGYFVMQ